MKKKIATLLLIAVSTGVWSQSSVLKINTNDSKIHWLAKKVTGQHDGFINLIDGSLELDDEQITGGTFTVDMTSINVADLTGEYKEKLEGHLKSDDFFSVEQFPKSTLKITKANQKMANHYEMTADLTIKGITHPVTFEMHVEGDSANTKFMIDRSKYNVRYGSNSFFDNLGDKAIYDEFELDINLKF